MLTSEEVTDDEPSASGWRKLPSEQQGTQIAPVGRGCQVAHDLPLGTFSSPRTHLTGQPKPCEVWGQTTLALPGNVCAEPGLPPSAGPSLGIPSAPILPLLYAQEGLGNEDGDLLVGELPICLVR